MNRIMRPTTRPTNVEQASTISKEPTITTKPRVITPPVEEVRRVEGVVPQDNNEYNVKARVKEFTVFSSATFKIRDNYYKFECSETREIPEHQEVNMELELQAAFDQVNTMVDDQLVDLKDSLGL